MSDFNSVPPNQAVLDPSKRVNYTQGLVLGVDEFNQEQLFFLERDRLHNRALHGYGTVHGLRVSVETKDDKPQVMVSPGMAVDPQGQHICVPSGQCGDLNKWLQRNRGDVPGRVVGNRLPVYVQLCYRECKTDDVPIPGGPCRTQEESMAASRIAEDFELRLSLSPPVQLEEDRIREFGEVLQQIEITDEPGAFLSEDQMIGLVRTLPGSPPLADEPLRLRTNQACDILQAMFRVWVTEVRPMLLRTGRCGGMFVSKKDSCVLLAMLELDVLQTAEGYYAVDESRDPFYTISENQRPYLLTTRLLQEWLMCGRPYRTRPVHTFATLFARDETTIRAWVHYPRTLPPEAVRIEPEPGQTVNVYVALDIPPEALTVEINDTSVDLNSVTQVPGVNVFDLELKDTSLKDNSLVDEDQVTVRFKVERIFEIEVITIHASDGAVIETTTERRPLVEALGELNHVYLDREGDEFVAHLTVGRPRLDDLWDVNSPSPGDGQALIWDAGQWQPGAPSPGGPAGGDLSGEYPKPSVVRIQGQLVSSKEPQPGQVLTWGRPSPIRPTRLGWWQAADPPEGVTDHGELTSREDDDHEQYLRTDGTRALTGDQSAGGHKITNLANATSLGDAMPHGQPAGRDLSGTYPDPTVARLQNRDVALVEDDDINAGDVLTWNESENQWEPQPAPAGPDGGAYVQAPGGPYAIVAAGFFNPDGTPRTPTYNDLQATADGNGGYLLSFPGYDYDSFIEGQLAYIVKGTVYDEGLNIALDMNPLEDDEYVENRLGLATFAVMEFNERGILVWITQPTLESNTILRVVDERMEEIDNVLHFRPVPRALMVEISQYPLIVDIETAPATVLRTIPRIGPALAERIVATRAEMGGFTAIEDLLRVPGIGEGNLEHIRPFITIRRR